ncbi:hypothetical protein GOP47_0000503 [Adiantum capillus-veneris]|uniref:Uncharacterized protein n=1 Tax=Adiantum capillus-veneris TaxID=13818 RepID=A0A9D4VE09_ADICA|nr:hypothetical protein GOP47_0000503 [Adiantum capillus-veneris]
MEIPTIPKVVLDNLLASMSSPATFKEPAPLIKRNNGLRQLPMPLFHGASLRPPTTAVPSRPPASSLLPGGGHMRDLATSPQSFFKECADPFAKEGSVLPPIKEKPKRVRKSRAGVPSNKIGASDAALYSNLEGAQQLQSHPPKRRRPSTKLLGDGETVEKPPPRKRNRSKAKAEEEQLFSFSTNETSFGLSDPTCSKGILGLYGLETKTLDLSRYMKDISIESLMAGDFNTPSVSGKQVPPANTNFDNSFGSHVSSILQNLTSPANTDQARPGSLISKPAESKLLKLALDLECSPIDGSEECIGIGLFESNIKVPHIESSAPFLPSRKAHEAPPLFSLESVPVIPPTDFWNTLQIQPNVSLSSLIAQASTTTDSRFFPSDVGSNCEKFSSVPPSIFSLGSSHIPQESSNDRLANSKLNHWFRAEPLKWESGEGQSHNSTTFSRGSMFPFKLDTGSDSISKPSERCGLKMGLFDIDLNKESPEAKAAESIIAHSTSIDLSNAQVLTKVPAFEQAKVDACATVEEPQSVQTTLCVNAPTPVNEVDYTCNITSLPDCQDVNLKSESHVALQQNFDVAERLNRGNSDVAERASGDSVSHIVNKQHSSEQVKDVTTNAPGSLPTLSVPEVPETLEMSRTDVPYSPGMHAIARILCKMANSSSPFYVESNDKDAQLTGSDDAAYMQRPAKAAKLSGLFEKEARRRKPSVLDESWSEECMVKAHSKDGKDKLMFGHLGSTSGTNTEPWASTPPRHAPKNVVSRMSGSQSSESDRSPCCGPKEHRSHKDLSNSNTSVKDHHRFGVASSCKVSSSFSRKDQKGNPKPVPKTTFLHTLPTKGLSVSSQKRSSPVERKQSLTAYGDGLAKVSRPRSNTSKNGLQLQRNTNGCSLKSSNPRHVLPYVGEVRHGSK